jgi:hypothetical protein
VPGTIERNGTSPPASTIDDLGSARLSGEIVDSKCFLGVMNPGRLERRDGLLFLNVSRFDQGSLF